MEISKGAFLNFRSLILFIAVVAVLILRWKYELGLTAFLVFFVLPIILAFVVFPLIAKKRFPQFENQIKILNLKGKHETASEVYRKSFFMRVFGPPGEMNRLLGQTLSFVGKWSEAKEAFLKALKVRQTGWDITTMSGYAEACFHTGEDREALRILTNPLLENIRLPLHVYYRIHLLLHDKKKIAKKIFDEAGWEGNKESKDSAIRNLALSELYFREKKLDEAEKELNSIQIEQLPPSLHGMALLLKARICLQKSKKDDAEKIISDLKDKTFPGRHLLELKQLDVNS